MGKPITLTITLPKEHRDFLYKLAAKENLENSNAKSSAAKIVNKLIEKFINQSQQSTNQMNFNDEYSCDVNQMELNNDYSDIVNQIESDFSIDNQVDESNKDFKW